MLRLSGTVDPITLTVEQMPAHDHDLWVATNSSAGSGISGGQGSPIWHDGYMMSTGSSQSHSHSFTGSSGNGNNLPPYYCLAMIMRIL